MSSYIIQTLNSPAILVSISSAFLPLDSLNDWQKSLNFLNSGTFSSSVS